MNKQQIVAELTQKYILTASEAKLRLQFESFYA